VFHAVSLMYAPVIGFAVRPVPLTPSTSGSSAARLTFLTGGVIESSPSTPWSPDAMTR
jgi:hypothetical protein